MDGCLETKIPREKSSLMTAATATSKIALVDDDPSILKLFGQYLASLGHSYVAFSNGQDALDALARGETFDVFLLDVMMPKMNGFELCARIREIEAHRYSPVMFMTALDDEQAEQSALAAGADDLLTKPIRRAELALRVAALLRLKRVQGELAEKNARLQRNEQQRSLFTSMLVHDLKSPLLCILMNLDFVAEDVSDNPAVSQALADSIEMTWRIQRRVHAMLALAKSESVGIEPQLEDIALKTWMATVVAGQRKQAAAAGIVLKLECPADLRVKADREMLSRVFENLLDNAFRFSPQGSTVTLKAEIAAARMLLSVNDEGPGIPAEKAKHIFEPFAQGDDHSRTTANAGLGLAFCRVAAEAHHGVIEALPGPQGAGTSMRLSLPI
jgi:two-component system, sensor histidine kinase and response regulator